MAAAAAEGGGGVEEGVGESSSPPRDPAAAPTASGGSGGGAGGLNICNQVYERLVAEGNEEAAAPDFRAQLEAHFMRLPHSYQLDINVDKAEDVLVHQKVLAEAKDPDRRPAFHVRFLRIEEVDPTYDSDASEDGADDGDDLSVSVQMGPNVAVESACHGGVLVDEVVPSWIKLAFGAACCKKYTPSHV